MAQNDFLKAANPKTNMPDGCLALLGYLHWMKKNDPEFLSKNPDLKLPEIPPDIKPFSTESLLEAVNPVEWNLDEIPPDAMEQIKQDFMSRGMGSYLEDGIITTEEWLMSISAQGQAKILQNPDKFDLSDQEIEAAKDVFHRHGIENPGDGLVRGMAAFAEDLAPKINEGLGIPHDQTALHEISNSQIAAENLERTISSTPTLGG